MEKKSFIICHITGKTYFSEKVKLDLLKSDCYVTCNGLKVHPTDPIEDGKVYHIIPRLVGGKGGFGSMLRAIGAQIEKTTSREACRDISGRRLRDVNNEKKLKEWINKKAEKDKERAREKQERREKRLAMPNHKFEDEVYHEQRKKVAENQEDALLEGLQKVNKPGPSCTVTSETASCSGVKRKAEDQGPSIKSKKKTEWLGIDIDNLSDLDSDEDSEASSTQPDNPSSNNSNSPSPTEEIETSQIKVETPSQADKDTSSTDTSQQRDIFLNNENQSKTTEMDEKMESNDAAKNKVNKLEEIRNEGNTEKKETIERVEKHNKSNELLNSLKTVQPNGKKENVEITNNKDNHIEEPLNLEDYNSPEELQAVGLERLKAALMERKMKCGGNLEQRAERLFSVKGLSDDQIPPSLLAKPSKKK